MREGVGQESLVHAGRSLLDADAIGYANEPRGWSQSMSGVGISHEDDAISHANIANLGTKFLHDPNSLAAESCRKLRFAGALTAVEGLTGKLAASLLYIKKVNAGGFHAHQGLSRAGNWRGEFFPLHDLWTAVGMNANGAH